MGNTDKKTNKGTVKFIFGKVISEIFFITLLSMFLYIFMPDKIKENIEHAKYIIIIIIIILIIMVSIKYYRIYTRIYSTILNIDKIKKSNNSIKEFKDTITILDYQVDKFSKKHDYLRTLSPLTIISIIITVATKLPAQASNSNISSAIMNIWDKCYTFDFKSMSIEEILVLSLILFFVWCTYGTLTSYIRYNELNYERNMYKRELN